MKKILGISLCALFAVSAANAEIASKAYVDEQIGGIDTSGIEENAGAITALTGRVSANETSINGHNTRITANADAISGINSSMDTLEGRVGVNEGKIAQNETDITALEGTVAGHTTSITGINNSMNTLSGKVTANEGNIATNKTNIDTNTEAIAALQESVTGLGDLAHEDTVTTNFITDGTIMNADISDTAKIAMNKIDFSSVQTGAIDSGIDSAKVGQIATNASDIDTLQATADSLKALAYKDTVTSTEITDGTIMNADINGDAQIDSGKIKFSDTQKKVFNSGITGDLVGQITTNKDDITELSSKVTANKNSITDLQGRMSTAEDKIASHLTKINANKAAIDQIVSATGATECAATADGCALVYSSTGFKWEAVKR